MPTGKYETTTEVPVKGAQSPIKASFTLETTHENLLVILDKPFQEGFIERTANALKVQHAGFPYDKASNLIRAMKGEEPAGDTGGFEAQGLDDRIDDLLADASDALKKTRIVATSGTDADGKRNLEVRVEYDGAEIARFSADDLKGLSSAISTALDETESTGGEVVEANHTPVDDRESVSDKPADRWRGVVTKYRATANGENDRIDNENENTLVQTKAGFIVISAADININAGINATFAIFIA